MFQRIHSCCRQSDAGPAKLGGSAQPPMFAGVSLERSATQARDLFDWFQDVAITPSGLGLNDAYNHGLFLPVHRPVGASRRMQGGT